MFHKRQRQSGFPCDLTMRLSLIVRVRLRNHFVEFAGADVRLELGIPSFPILLEHPLTQLRELSRRKLANLLFNVFNFAHRYRPRNYTPDANAHENVNRQWSANDEVERRGASPASNEGTLSN